MTNTIKGTTKIGQIIRTTRKDQGLNQEQLATTAGVGTRFIRELEQGKDSCHLGKVLSVLSMLGIKVTLNDDTL